MKLLRLVLIPLTLTTGLFGEGILGQDAFLTLEEIKGEQIQATNNGTSYMIDRLQDLPVQVKPGAIIKIKKQTASKDDPDKVIVIQSITNAQEERSALEGKDVKEKDGMYLTIMIPKTNNNLEFEVLFNMQSEDEKYQLYKYWIYAHTFEIEQPGEKWKFTS